MSRSLDKKPELKRPERSHRLPPQQNPQPPQDDQEERDRQTRGLAALALILALLIASLFLVRRLSEASRLQDCLMQGRPACGANSGMPARP